MSEYLVERYEVGIGAEGLRREARRLATAVAQLKREGSLIEFLGSTFMPIDEGVFSLFSSESEELVVAAHKLAAVPFERVVVALPIEIEGGTR